METNPLVTEPLSILKAGNLNSVQAVVQLCWLLNECMLAPIFSKKMFYVLFTQREVDSAERTFGDCLLPGRGTKEDTLLRL